MPIGGALFNSVVDTSHALPNKVCTAEAEQQSLNLFNNRSGWVPCDFVEKHHKKGRPTATVSCYALIRLGRRLYLTRFNKTAVQGTPQMAVDKEANSLSRVYS